MAKDSSSPATKKDSAMLMESIGKLYDDIHEFKDDVSGKITDLKGEIEEKIAASEDRVKRHFDVVAEDLRHDVLGANRDEIESIKDRVIRIERHVGLRAA
ncbi:MAG: hypothetical protein V1926_06445 [Candidatus Peregrinibacteria bacterium]